MSESSGQGSAPRSEVTAVDAFPPCDINPAHGAAAYDAKTTMGPWGNLCPTCFENFGYGLGLGIGQRLVLRVKP